MSRLVRACGAALLLLVAAGCRPAAPKPFSAEGLAGPLITPPIPKPDFTLPATDGTPFAFRKETEGFVTLLFLGYTHCPDVCPVHLANIAAALAKASPEVNARIKVVFVTTDPARDTPAVVRTWLDKFDHRFIGLVGTKEEVQGVLRGMRLPPFGVDSTPGDTTYYIDHAAMVLAFSRDNLAHVVYPFGIQQAAWSNDLAILARED
jgi:protein SCO1/2